MLDGEAEDDPTGPPIWVQTKTALSSAADSSGLDDYLSKELFIK